VVGCKDGERFGTVVSSPRMLDVEDLSADEWEVLREPTPDDYKSLEEDAEVERDAFKVCQQLISKRKLPMKLVKVEYAFDRSQALFYFTAETRVDFRELVRDLAHKFRTRIELKQVGVRDEARILGGIGYCGRELCCKAFLKSFQPVSKKMARDQNLTLNPSKISGICGRLLCCLIYEQETYEELRRKFPKEGSMVDTPSGPGRVKMLNPLRDWSRSNWRGEPPRALTFPSSHLHGRSQHRALERPRAWRRRLILPMMRAKKTELFSIRDVWAFSTWL